MKFFTSGNMEKRDALKYLVIGMISIGLIGALLIFGGWMTGYAVFEDLVEGDFDNGTYVNLIYNGSAVVLSGDNLTGSYTSQVFDAGSDASWNNLSWVSGEFDLESFFCVDGGGDVYSSIDFGVTWSMTKEDYGRTTDTSYMFSDLDYIYILSNSNKEVWRSLDSGVSWSVVNDTFADSGLLVGGVNSDYDLFVVDASGDVYVSLGDGVTWILQGDFNAGATNNPKGIGINSTDALFIVDGAGDVYSSIDSGINWVKVNDGYGGSTGTDDMTANNEGVYILLNKDIYKSTDGGITWNLINDSFTDYSNDGLRMSVDRDDNLFILDGAGRVFKSVDSGVSWVEVGDCNNAASNDPQGLTNFIQATNLDFQVRSCDDDPCSGESWIDITDNSPQDLSVNNNQYFQYRVSFTNPDSSVSPVLESVSVDYIVLNTAPSIILVSPQDGATYGYNESITLDFSVSDADSNIDSCWYNFDEGENVSLASCANTTFDVAEGSYVLYVYVNDTQEEASDSASFDVQVGAPTIILNSPINVYLNYQENIQFDYIPTDVDLDSCELWGNFTGSFVLNQTDTSPVSGSVNSFVLNLSDGDYLWNIKCNDSVGNSVFNGNKSFYVDTINPDLSLSEPSDVKTSRTVSAEWSFSDVNPVNCFYNVYQGASLDITNTSVNCSVNSVSFDVSADGSFVINFYINDSAGNTNSTNLSFSVDTSSSPPSSDGGGGGGGGGSGAVITNLTKIGKIEVSEIGNIIAYAGTQESLSLNVRNIGKIFLNNCRLIVKGEISSWANSNIIEGIAPGENKDFNFDINVPEEIVAGDYSGELEIKCDESNDIQNVLVSIPGLGSIKIKDIQQEENILRVIYEFDNSNIIGESVLVDIWLEDGEGYGITRFQDVFNINRDGLIERTIEFELENVAGIYYVYLALSDDLDNFVRESVVLGEAEGTGFVVFDTDGGKFGVYIVFLLVLGIAVFLIWRRHGKAEPSKHHWFFGKKGKKK